MMYLALWCWPLLNRWEKQTKQLKQAVHKDINKPLKTKNGVAGETILLAQLEGAAGILEIKDQAKMIVFCGDCFIS